MGETGGAGIQEINLNCTAATLMKFHASGAAVRAVLGPFSSGKSHEVCVELFLLSLEMPPCRDGVRRTAIGFFRENATLIKDSMMKTWISIFREDPGHTLPYRSWVTWSQPMSIRMKFPHPSKDGTEVDIQIYCRHQGSPEDSEDLKGMELTHAWFDEVNKVPEICVGRGHGRTGRFPAEKDMAPGWPTPRFCTFLTSNLPHEKHWLWQKRLNPPEGWEFFLQPPAYFYEGRDAEGRRIYTPNTGQRLAQGILPAENIEHLQEGWKYYEKMLNSMRHEDALVLVCAQPGQLMDGEPVYGAYSAERHYTGKRIPFDVTKTLFLGFDWGFWPTCVFCQVNNLGQLCVLDMVDGEGRKMGIEQLWKSVLREKLINEYRFGAGAQIWAICDPAVGGSQVNMDDCRAFVERQGINIRPCATNNPTYRIGAVDHFLRSTVAGGLPGFQIGLGAFKIHEGMNGYYVLKTEETGVGKTYSSVPVKNGWSHSQDAVQYVAHAIKNPTLYDIAWRNTGGFGDIGGVAPSEETALVQPGPDVGLAGVV